MKRKAKNITPKELFSQKGESRKQEKKESKKLEKKEMKAGKEIPGRILKSAFKLRKSI